MSAKGQIKNSSDTSTIAINAATEARSQAQTSGPHWSDRPRQKMSIAADIAGVSAGSLYRAAAEGRLKLLRLAGRTLVDTASLITFMKTAEDWKPSKRGSAAVAARVERARAAWQE